MVKTRYVPNASFYDAYYTQKGGSGLNFPVFQGSVIQRGYGLGGLIAGLARSIVPFIGKTIAPIVARGARHAIPIVKKGAVELGKHAFKSGTQSLADVLAKKKTPRSALASQAAEMQQKLAEMIAKPTPKKRKRKRTATVSSPQDIFL